MSQERQALGRWGEECAVRYLRRRLYRIVATNYSNRCGEIDIIARRGGILAFIEVKTRRTTRFGHGVEAVNARKQRQIIRTAQLYLLGNSFSRELQPRFDVMSILLHADTQQHSIEHLTDAFGL